MIPYAASYRTVTRLVLLLALGILTVPQRGIAQKEYNIWYFSQNAGLDFNGGPPTALTDSKMDGFTEEGTASICDPVTGKLLFYTNGMNVWNARHDIMPNGRRLLGHISSTQAALIVPLPGNPSIFYLFTTDAGPYYEAPNDGFHYSIVDMTQDNGLGDVTVKNVPLLDSATEKLTAVRHCNGRDFWIIAHAWESADFHVYKLNPSGLKGPIVTKIGAYHGGDFLHSIGYLKASSDGRKLVSVVNGVGGSVELFDFDNTTGTISNPIELPAGEFEYGACFSPDNSRLYISREHKSPDALFQYTVTGSSAAEIIASRTQVALTDSLGALALGPDGKIYVARLYAERLAVIDNPNAAGAACNYHIDGPDLGGRKTFFGLPNNIDSYYLPPALACLPPNAMFSPDRTDICVGDCVDFTDRSSNDPQNWEWMFEGGRTASSVEQHPKGVCYDAPGTFQARLIASKVLADGDEISDTTIQTITVHPAPSADAGPDTTICAGEPVQLKGTGGDTYSWTPSGSLSCSDCASPIATPQTTTVYTVTVRNALGCVAVDSVTVSVKPAPKITATPTATTICSGETVSLLAEGGSSYQWSPVAGLSCTDCPNPIASPSKTTTYVVRSSAPGTCDGLDSVVVTVVEALDADAGEDLRICRGDSLPIGATGSTGLYQWTPTVGLSCSDCLTPMASPSVTTTYQLTIRSAGTCVAVDSVTVWVSDPPTVDAGPNVRICKGEGAPLHATGGVAYQWSPATGLSCTDCPEPIASPTATTAYFVRVTNAEGCSATDAVTVSVDPSPRVVHTHADDHTVYTGDYIRVPIVLDDPLDSANVDSLRISLTYNDGMMLLRDEALDGTMLQGWDLSVIEEKPGSFSAWLIAPPFRSAKGTGSLIDLGFLVYLRSASTSCVDYSVMLPGNQCTEVLTRPGCITLNPICGIGMRFIEATSESYALEGNRPNPFNPTTEILFSVGLDGPTRLEIHDAVGKLVAVLVDQHLAAGKYSVTWDATDLPSGMYYSRLVSGTWSQTHVMTLVK